VTGSHNPAEFNGFKICRGRETLYEDGIQQIRKLVEGNAFSPAVKKGRRRRRAALPSYLAYLKKHFGRLRTGGRLKKPLEVVVDGGNGTAGLVVPHLLRGLGCRVVELYCEPDGRFPHHHPDPTLVANLADLQSVVREVHADLGVAYDGDGDRLGVVDKRGEVVWGDRLLAIYARQVLEGNPGAICIGDVKCSQLFFDDVERRGGIPLMWRTGHSLIKAKMRETGALLAGEMSGHFFFADRYFGYDDAIYATCRLIEILHTARRQNAAATLSDLLADLPPSVATPEIRRFCPEEHKQTVIHRLTERIAFLIENSSMPGELRADVDRMITLDGVRLSGKNGWALVRASNTEPALILRFEASQEALLKRYRLFIEGLLAEFLTELGIKN
jgi:phosphomannomutase / phosphoglucomutase